MIRVFAACGFIPARKSGLAASSECVVYTSTGCRIVLLKGAEGPSQKMIARVVNEKTGATIAYVKYGEAAAAMAKVEAENQILTALESMNGEGDAMDAAGLAPRVRWFGPIGDGVALEISPVDGDMLPTDISLDWSSYKDSPLYSLLSSLDRGNDEYQLDHHPAVKRLVGAAGSRFDIEPVLQRLRERRWRTVVQHGDLTPWNILRQADGNLVAIDWEEAVLEGFPYFDVIYFFIQTGCLIHNWKPGAVFEHLYPLLKSENLSDDEIESLIRLCALDAYFRFGSGKGNPRLQEFRIQVFSCEYPL